MKKLTLAEMQERNWLNCGAFSRKNFTGMHLEARYDARNERNYIRVSEGGKSKSTWYIFNGTTAELKQVADTKVPDWVRGAYVTAPSKRKYKRPITIPEWKYYDGEAFELLQGYLESGSGPEGGYATKAQAQKNAKGWREGSDDSKARMVKIGDYYYIYGN